MLLFTYRLALSLGLTVTDLQNKMTSSEFAHWVAYYSIEPWGSTIDGLRHGYTASTVYNTVASAAGSKEGPVPLPRFTIGVEHQKKKTTKEDIEKMKAKAALDLQRIIERNKNARNRHINRSSKA